MSACARSCWAWTSCTYDLYTPLVAEADAHIEFADAKKTVLEALSCMGEDYCKVLKEGFDNRWIDVYENAGKRSGAYSAGSRVHPYVLLNYTGTLDSQFTLAHEMGHAMHSYLSNHNQNHGLRRLCDLRGGGRLHLQRGPADGVPPRQDHG